MRRTTLTVIVLAALAGLRLRLCRPLRASGRAPSALPHIGHRLLRGCTPPSPCAATTQQSPSQISRCRHLRLRAVGATTNLGQSLPWTPLRYTRHAWHALLPAPEFRGIYPLELRIRQGSPILRSEHWLLRVFAHGTQSRPSSSTPEGVARGWVQTLPLQARLVAMKRWPQPAFDLRDHRRHQLLVIAYTLAGHRAVEDRLGNLRHSSSRRPPRPLATARSDRGALGHRVWLADDGNLRTNGGLTMSPGSASFHLFDLRSIWHDPHRF